MAMLKELEYNKNGSMKQKNVQLLVMALIRIASLYDSILSFVEAMLALRTKRKWDEHNADKHPVVTLSTMHSAKGQEYDHVIIIDAVEDLMPGDRSKPLPFWHASWQAHVEEERRLFYVAATRARHDLRIVVNGLNSSSPKAPSPFIHEMLRDNPNIPVENWLRMTRLRSRSRKQWAFRTLPFGEEKRQVSTGNMRRRASKGIPALYTADARHGGKRTGF